ncbi:MAG: CDP-diacylglycerol---glycerol-3-phosphate 3-phosphatidyltransferase [Solirubrobacteraceae bacterium]|jgi:CDP-diacylglycerol--glycerol-3-phosphate 3-phosphatidyltransferase|nr:CDP-diacylglycerol---glycerol-3-phosphate 3-phosphatidyltransferase [Solirubrobacteraceae bacterium]MEA2243875.1 CDP-diacylglycerol---glycerol-3-phosphate 3-phosphatidyltransferase [Solirubrobacteraceae bacterium]
MRAGTQQPPPPPTDPGPAPPGGRAGRSRRSRPGAERLEALRERLVASRLTPNQISMTGFVLNVIAAVLVWQHEFFIGGVVFIVGSICDTLDGGYSRMSGKGTPFGAFLDSTLDRIVEGIVLTAVAVTFTQRGDELAVAAVVVAVMASLVVSYTRARAEALGVECKVGIADRLVRVIILSAGLVFADLGALEPAVYVLAALSSFTVVQRILHVRRELAQPASM